MWDPNFIIGVGVRSVHRRDEGWAVLLPTSQKVIVELGLWVAAAPAINEADSVPEFGLYILMLIIIKI